MKRSRQLALLVMAQTPWLLTACDDASTGAEEAVTRQGFYTSVDACERDGNTKETCEHAAQTADTAHSTSAPRYKTREECIAEFGEMCTEHRQEGGFWMPLMTGFLISQMLSPGRPAAYLGSSPIYTSRSGQYVQSFRNAGPGVGGATGARMRPIDVTPNRAITVSRSGFGSMSAARSGWGGSSRGG